MNRALSGEDGRAVDLLLDQGLAAMDDGVKEIIPAVSAERVSAVQSLLSLLDHIPVVDPPAKLIERTMRLIDEATGNAAGHASRRPTIDPTPA